MKDSEKLAEQIYKEYYDKVRQYISSKVSDIHDADDLAATVFLKVCQRLETFDSRRASISTWIYTITRNTVVDYYRTLKQHCELQEQSFDEHTIEHELLWEESLQELAKALVRLSMRERDLIVLHYHKNYTLKQISEMMNMSYANIKVLHKNALMKLKKYLEDSKTSGIF